MSKKDEEEQYKPDKGSEKRIIELDKEKKKEKKT
jgi:hypothetical protein